MPYIVIVKARDHQPSSICNALSIALVLLASSFAGAQYSDADIAKAVVGKSLFRTYCVSCHGTKGEGDGFRASSLSSEPVDLTRLSAANEGVFPMARVLKVIDGREPVEDHSTADMPAWGEILEEWSGDPDEAEMRIEQLALFVQSIQEE